KNFKGSWSYKTINSIYTKHQGVTKASNLPSINQTSTPLPPHKSIRYGDDSAQKTPHTMPEKASDMATESAQKTPHPHTGGVELNKACLPADYSEPKDGTLENLLMWAHNWKNDVDPFVQEIGKAPLRLYSIATPSKPSEEKKHKSDFKTPEK
ncbi:hypothetical protein Tco_1187995, partial [Tanacetum coccineum]